MDGGWGFWRVRALTGMFAAMIAAQAHAEAGRCQPTIIGSAAIQAVLDGRTVRLADGRELRLVGIEIPNRPDEARAAKAALAGLAEGRSVTLARLSEDTDRYGRVLALAFLALAAGVEASVQHALVAQGHARVAARVGDRDCASPLLAAEQAARAARRGLWGDARHVIRSAQNPDQILAERGTFTLVEGRVLSVRESGATIYVNFGRRWSEDFTVTVPRRSERMFAAAGVTLKDLVGQRVRVRGFVEERGGPWIEAARPEQIEVAERD